VLSRTSLGGNKRAVPSVQSGESEIHAFRREKADGARADAPRLLRGKVRRRPDRHLDDASHDGELGSVFACLAGRDVDSLSWRDRSLRRRVHRGGVVVAPDDIVFAGSSRPRSTGGRPRPSVLAHLHRAASRSPSDRTVLIVRADAPDLIWCQSPGLSSATVQVFANGDEGGGLRIVPGGSFVDVGGLRYWVADAWMYELLRLQMLRKRSTDGASASIHRLTAARPPRGPSPVSPAS
jgi:hypothetical protein